MSDPARVMAEIVNRHLTAEHRSLVLKAAADRPSEFAVLLSSRGGWRVGPSSEQEFAGFVLMCARRALEGGAS